MDMDSSHHNWLAFSLSNHSLFQPFIPPCGGVVDQGHGSGAASASGDHRISVPGGAGPKLEDFLGVSGGSSGGPTADGVAEFETGAQAFNNMPEVQIYDDSELKNIAASFLRGFSTEQSDATRKQQVVAPPPPEPVAKKVVETFGQRTSIFRGVTRHRWTGRYEAHLWDNSCRREGQSRKGRQVYLGGYDKEEKAARAYDLAALKYWGPTTTTNFPVVDYEKEMEEMKHMTRQEFVASLRRKSSGFSRGASIYRGVTRHHQHGRWQARIGRVAGNKDLYLGTFSTQEEAAEAYDIAAIKFRGLNAVTNFDMSRYDVKSIASSNLPVGGATNKSKTSSGSDNRSEGIQSSEDNNKDNSSATSVPFPSQNPTTATITFGLPIKQDQSSRLWAALGYQTPSMANNARNPSTAIPFFRGSSAGTGTTLQSTTPLSMEFQNFNHSNHGQGFYSGCGYYQQQGNDGTPSSSSASFAAGTVSSNGTSRDPAGVFGHRNWTPAPPVHSFQAAKDSLSALQTPIFGME